MASISSTRLRRNFGDVCFVGSLISLTDSVAHVAAVGVASVAPFAMFGLRGGMRVLWYFGVCGRPGAESYSHTLVGVISCAADSSVGQSREFSVYLQLCQKILVCRLTALSGPGSPVVSGLDRKLRCVNSRCTSFSGCVHRDTTLVGAERAVHMIFSSIKTNLLVVFIFRDPSHSRLDVGRAYRHVWFRHPCAT